MSTRLAMIAVFAGALSVTTPAFARVEAWATGRVGLGGGATLERFTGVAFTPSLSGGVKLLVLTGGADRAWTLTADVGVAWTRGYGPNDTTLGSVGLSPGRLWGGTGVSWAPRVLVGVRNGDETVWGLRNGIRVNFIAGVVDLELAHQYLRGDAGVTHELQFTVGLDLGLAVHALVSWSTPRRASPPPPPRTTDLTIAR